MMKLAITAKHLRDELLQQDAHTRSCRKGVIDHLDYIAKNITNLSLNQRKAMATGLFRIIADDEHFFQSDMGKEILDFTNLLMDAD